MAGEGDVDVLARFPSPRLRSRERDLDRGEVRVMDGRDARFDGAGGEDPQDACADVDRQRLPDVDADVVDVPVEHGQQDRGQYDVERVEEPVIALPHRR